MDDAQRFEQLDELERVYAPEELPVEEQARVRADEGRVYQPPDEPLPALPIANMGNAPSAAMAPVLPEEPTPVNADGETDTNP